MEILHITIRLTTKEIRAVKKLIGGSSSEIEKNIGLTHEESALLTEMHDIFEDELLMIMRPGGVVDP